MSGGGLLSKALPSDNFVNEGSKDGHHSGTSVVKLGVLLANFLGGLGFPVVQGSKPYTVVAIKLGGRPPGKFNKPADKDDLKKTCRWNLEKTSDSGVNVGELKVLGWGKVSIEGPVVVVHKGTQHGHHGNTSVLAFNGTVANELILVGDVSQRIEESKRSSGTNFSLSDHVQGSRGGSLWCNGGKGGGRADHGKGGDELHGCRDKLETKHVRPRYVNCATKKICGSLNFSHRGSWARTYGACSQESAHFIRHVDVRPFLHGTYLGTHTRYGIPPACSAAAGSRLLPKVCASTLRPIT